MWKIWQFFVNVIRTNNFAVNLGADCSAMASVELMCNSCIRGYHIYMKRWTPSIGEVLYCSAQNNNTADQYAFTVCQEDGTIVGHVPKKLTRVCWLFLRKHNLSELLCTVTGGSSHSSDLPQGGN